MIKLGLQDVLYDPVNKTLITPNTGQVLALGNGGLNNPATDGKIEPRANPNHDPKTGRFTNGTGKNSFTVAQKNKTKKELTNDEEKGIIKSFTTGKSLGAAAKNILLNCLTVTNMLN